MNEIPGCFWPLLMRELAIIERDEAFLRRWLSKAPNADNEARESGGQASPSQPTDTKP